MNRGIVIGGSIAGKMIEHEAEFMRVLVREPMTTLEFTQLWEHSDTDITAPTHKTETYIFQKQFLNDGQCSLSAWVLEDLYSPDNGALAVEELFRGYRELDERKRYKK